MSTVITHVVLFKWKEGTPEATIAEIVQEVKDLVKVMPFIVALTFGKVFNDRNQGHTEALTVVFKNREDLETYGKDETHMAVVTGKILPNAENVIACDYESPVLAGAAAEASK